jgi:hypothetical protein
VTKKQAIIVAGIGTLVIWGTGSYFDILLETRVSWIGILVSIIWTCFTYFDQRRSKEKIEKIRFLNQKDIEAFKVYTGKKQERISDLYTKMVDVINGCYGLQDNPVKSIDYSADNEKEIKDVISAIHLPENEQNRLLECWESDHNNGIAEIHKQQRTFKHYEVEYQWGEFANSLNQVRLYIPEECFDDCKKIVEIVKKFLSADETIINKNKVEIYPQPSTESDFEERNGEFKKIEQMFPVVVIKLKKEFANFEEYVNTDEQGKD